MSHNLRFTMALYYAFGRQDAEPTVKVDPLGFAEFHMAQWQEFTSGACSFMPSVQDSWDTYRRSLRVV